MLKLVSRKLAETRKELDQAKQVLSLLCGSYAFATLMNIQDNVDLQQEIQQLRKQKADEFRLSEESEARQIVSP